MIKPKRLKAGDKVAVVSLSTGLLGEPWAIHKFHLAKQRMQELFGLELVAMPNALKGVDYLYKHPEARAEDLMEAFKNPEIKAIFCAIGGYDTIRLLPYIDFDVIKNNPKIFSGFSDSTTNHFMCFYAGLMSFYGPNIMNDFSQYVFMSEYTINAVRKLWFDGEENFKIESSRVYSLDEDKVWWGEEHINEDRKWRTEEKGYEILQGTGKVQGELLGGCIDVFFDLLGTKIWPKTEEWKNKILFFENCEANMTPEILESLLRNLQAQGILENLSAIMVGKPTLNDHYEDYKKSILKIVAEEAGLKDMPIIYNVNFGHSAPMGIIPYGAKCEIDADNKTITLLESVVVD